MEKRNVIFFAAIFTVSSIGIFQLFNQMDNAYQIPYVSFCLLAILVLVSILFLIQDMKKIYRSFSVIALTIFALIANRKSFLPAEYCFDNRDYVISARGFDPDFIKKTAILLDQNQFRSGFYLDSATIKKTLPRYLTEVNIQPLMCLAYYTDFNNTFCLNSKQEMLELTKGRGEDRLQFWYNFFDLFGTEKNPFNYFRSNSCNNILIQRKVLLQMNDSTYSQKSTNFGDGKSGWVLVRK